MAGIAVREHPLLGARLLFVPTRTADGGVISARIERLAQSLGLHDVGIARRTVVERVDAVAHPVLIGVADEIETIFFGRTIPEGDHLAKLERRIHMQQRKWDLAGIEGLACQMQQDARILADRIHHHRPLKAGRHLAQNLDALGLEGLQMRQSVEVQVSIPKQVPDRQDCGEPRQCYLPLCGAGHQAENGLQGGLRGGLGQNCAAGRRAE
ncbi:hypothetical protein D3C87_1429950 [compost metagenome]